MLIPASHTGNPALLLRPKAIGYVTMGRPANRAFPCPVFVGVTARPSRQPACHWQRLADLHLLPCSGCKRCMSGWPAWLTNVACAQYVRPSVRDSLASQLQPRSCMVENSQCSPVPFQRRSRDWRSLPIKPEVV